MGSSPSLRPPDRALAGGAPRRPRGEPPVAGASDRRGMGARGYAHRIGPVLGRRLVEHLLGALARPRRSDPPRDRALKRRSVGGRRATALRTKRSAGTSRSGRSTGPPSVTGG